MKGVWSLWACRATGGVRDRSAGLVVVVVVPASYMGYPLIPNCERRVLLRVHRVVTIAREST